MIRDFFIKLAKSLQTRRMLFFFLVIRTLINSTFLLKRRVYIKTSASRTYHSGMHRTHTKNQRFMFFSFFFFFYLHQITFVPYSWFGSLFAFSFLFSFSIGQTDRVWVYVIVAPHSNIVVLYKYKARKKSCNRGMTSSPYCTTHTGDLLIWYYKYTTAVLCIWTSYMHFNDYYCMSCTVRVHWATRSLFYCSEWIYNIRLLSDFLGLTFIPTKRSSYMFVIIFYWLRAFTRTKNKKRTR